MGSPEMIQIITLVITTGTWVPFESKVVAACPNWIVRTGEREGDLSCFAIWVGKETAVGVEVVGFMVTLSDIHTSEEDVVIREPPGVGGVAISLIRLLAFCKRLVLMEASYLIDGLRFRVVEEWV